jgi:hypothetical protein
VPPQTPENVNPLIEKYIHAEFAKLGSKNTLSLEFLHGGKPWVADPNHWSYAAAARATEAVYGRAPDLTREGGSIPVTLTFADALGVNVLLLPMGRGDDGAHSTNEKLDRSNYIEGVSAIRLLRSPGFLIRISRPSFSVATSGRSLPRPERGHETRARSHDGVRIRSIAEPNFIGAAHMLSAIVYDSLLSKKPTPATLILLRKLSYHFWKSASGIAASPRAPGGANPFM